MYHTAYRPRSRRLPSLIGSLLSLHLLLLANAPAHGSADGPAPDTAPAAAHCDGAHGDTHSAGGAPIAPDDGRDCCVAGHCLCGGAISLAVPPRAEPLFIAARPLAQCAVRSPCAAFQSRVLRPPIARSLPSRY